MDLVPLTKPMPVQVPNFSQDELKSLNKASVGLSDALKKARANGKEPGNPLEPMINNVLESKKTELLEAPLFYQLLFVAADTGVDNIIETIHHVKEALKDDNPE